MVLDLAKIYARFVLLCVRYAHRCPPGLGWLLRRVKGSHVIRVDGRKFRFDRANGSMIATMVAGRWPEPETHCFLSQVVKRCRSPIAFVDVGAAVGEFAIDVAGFPGVSRVIAIDPDPQNLRCIRESAVENGFDNVSVLQTIVCDRAGPTRFLLNSNRGASGHLASESDADCDWVSAVTLDSLSERYGLDQNTVVLIDVEGAELLVMKGGRDYIRTHRPLIVFEYHKATKEHFALSEVHDVIGQQWKIYRLNSTGRLDHSFEETWNCVAVAEDSQFAAICAVLDDTRAD